MSSRGKQVLVLLLPPAAINSHLLLLSREDALAVVLSHLPSPSHPLSLL